MKITTVKIDGMMCPMCESHINDAIRTAFDVIKVKSSHKKGETVIESEESIDAGKLKKIIDSTGYIFISVSEEEQEKKRIFGLF